MSKKPSSRKPVRSLSDGELAQVNGGDLVEYSLILATLFLSVLK